MNPSFRLSEHTLLILNLVRLQLWPNVYRCDVQHPAVWGHDCPDVSVLHHVQRVSLSAVIASSGIWALTKYALVTVPG